MALSNLKGLTLSSNFSLDRQTLEKLNTKLDSSKLTNNLSTSEKQ